MFSTDRRGIFAGLVALCAIALAVGSGRTLLRREEEHRLLQRRRGLGPPKLLLGVTTPQDDASVGRDDPPVGNLDRPAQDPPAQFENRR